MPSNILLVEDEPDARRLLKFLLDAEGFRVVTAEDGREALDALDRDLPDLVLLDLMMPNVDGIAFTQAFRAKPEFQKTPILVVTARDQQIDKYEAYKVGANGYLTKPFDPIELLFQVRSLLSLSSKAEVPTAITLGDVTLDPARYLAAVRGTEVQLTKMETAVLQHLMKHPGVVFSAEALSDAVHPDHRSVDAIHAHVRHLRAKLEPDPREPRYVVTQGRKGYFFAAPGLA